MNKTKSRPKKGSRRFTHKIIPKVPVYKRDTYQIPETYSNTYSQNGITDPYEQTLLFHGTQFGGFRLKRIPVYLQEKEQFLSSWFNQKHEKGFFSFRVKKEFLHRFGELKIEPLIRSQYGYPEPDPEVLEESGFTLEDAREIQNLQERLNKFYSRFRVGLKMPSTGLSYDDRVDLARFNAVPNFQFRPKAGGRLFHSGPGTSYQRISSSLRSLLTINDEDTTEIDISAATIQFLNIVLEKQFGYSIIPKEEFSSGDPYHPFLEAINSELSQTQKITRDSVKNILYTLIFSNQNSEARNVNRRLRLQDLELRYSDLSRLFPDFLDMVKKIKSARSNNNGLMLPAHQLIFREESAYARDVLEECCLNQSFVVLPLHDSFITPRQNHSVLEEVMESVSKKRYGYVLAHKSKY